MISVSYYHGYIIFTPDDIDDNNSLISAMQKIKSSLIRYNSKTGSWEVQESALNDLNSLLVPIKKKLILKDTFTQFIKEKNDHNYREAVIKVGAVYSKLIKGSETIPHDKISKVTRFFTKAAVNAKSYKDGKWDGYINLYKRWTGEFPTGLLSSVTSVLEESKVHYHIVYDYDRYPQKEYNWVLNDGLIPDEDQISAVKAALEYGRGIIKAPTAFGKTALLAKRMVAEFGVTTLFVANKKALLDDAASDFQRGVVSSSGDELRCLSIKDGMFGKVKLPCKESALTGALEAPVVVATIQSLHARLQDPVTAPCLKDWLQNQCKLVIVDETQAIGTKTWDEVLNLCEAPYRFGLSATPKRTDGATIKLTAATGPIIFSTTAEEQIKKGRLCELDIFYKPFDHGLYNEEDAAIQYSDAYTACIVENDERNKILVEPALEMVKEGRHVLVLIQMIDHGHVLKNKFIENGIDPDEIRFIWGETPDKIRKSAIDEFRKGDFKIMIGSTIFDAGVNIPIISGVVLGGAGNSDITLIQRIGRGARNCNYEDILGYMPEFMKAGHGKKVTKVYDILDLNVKFFSKQSKNRYRNAQEEFGADRVHVMGSSSLLRRKYQSRAPKDAKAMRIMAQETQEKMKEIFG